MSDESYAIYEAIRDSVDFSGVSDAIMEGVERSMPDSDAIVEAIRQGVFGAVSAFLRNNPDAFRR